MLPLFNPRDVKNASLIGVVAGAVNFAAPANNNANVLRYLLAVTMANQLAVNNSGIALEDVNGNLLYACTPWIPATAIVFNVPIMVGVPGQNGMRINNLNGAGAQIHCWVQFADVRVAIEPEIFRT